MVKWHLFGIEKELEELRKIPSCIQEPLTEEKWEKFKLNTLNVFENGELLKI